METLLMNIFFILVILLVVIYFLYPENYKVEKSAIIKADPSDIFPLLNDLKKWDNWSPWAEKCSDMTAEYKGVAGVGSSMSWEGESKTVGKGSMTIVASEPDKTVAYDMEFEKPRKGKASGRFDLHRVEEGTSITWTMTGKNDFIGKIIWMTLCKREVNKNYVKGLENIKAIFEKRNG